MLLSVHLLCLHTAVSAVPGLSLSKAGPSAPSSMVGPCEALHSGAKVCQSFSQDCEEVAPGT